eukprot:CAMPEP_0170554300 /NCGR_PEP_ID=MMETSP0211-20121228/12155_1 /TAXON_ID=311385 /ORGANISM="Pseudokeronopsis sp., Strain OXSARD2" /LENGTH=72 /DNA_ID=CAMNT_0010863251 /DNA_START=2328 /DNA_END=2546 /DNA_ORIENTATION=-
MSFNLEDYLNDKMPKYFEDNNQARNAEEEIKKQGITIKGKRFRPFTKKTRIDVGANLTIYQSFEGHAKGCGK